mmetsp:Transcript_40922/g.123416  ORF Transcript_40922/g.123416 Transcript_40922/m.123416 type:complete len:130 (+) Transcript_40922:2360-2749(+)
MPHIRPLPQQPGLRFVSSCAVALYVLIFILVVIRSACVMLNCVSASEMADARFSIPSSNESQAWLRKSPSPAATEKRNAEARSACRVTASRMMIVLSYELKSRIRVFFTARSMLLLGGYQTFSLDVEVV